jgi:hypothetical protein
VAAAPPPRTRSAPTTVTEADHQRRRTAAPSVAGGFMVAAAVVKRVRAPLLLHREWSMMCVPENLEGVPLFNLVEQSRFRQPPLGRGRTLFLGFAGSGPRLGEAHLGSGSRGTGLGGLELTPLTNISSNERHFPDEHDTLFNEIGSEYPSHGHLVTPNTHLSKFRIHRKKAGRCCPTFERSGSPHCALLSECRKVPTLPARQAPTVAISWIVRSSLERGTGRDGFRVVGSPGKSWRRGSPGREAPPTPRWARSA